MVQLLRHSSACVLLAVLAIAPLAFGATRPAAFLTVLALVALAGVLWAAATLAVPAGASLPPVLLGGGLLVAVVALFWSLSPALPVPAFTTHHFARVVARWPHNVVLRDPLWLAAWGAALALALLAAVDLFRAPVWRERCATMVVATGTVVALLGLLENATHARSIYWQGGSGPTAFFGTFYHHTSAGAYLNTLWPLSLGLALEWNRRARRPARRASAFAALAGLLILGAHTGHISRFPQVVAAGTLAGLGLWMRPWRFISLPRRRRFLWAPILAGAVLTVGLAARANRTGEIRQRWAMLTTPSRPAPAPRLAPPPPSAWPKLMRPDLFIASDHRGYFLGDRGAAYATAWRAFLARPWLGWGPGGWTAAAAAHTDDPFIRTFFQMIQFTHDDFLQTLVEWGAVGAVGWALLIPAGLLRGLGRLGWHPERDFLAAGAIASLAAVLVQSLIDFPLQIPAVLLNAVALAALAWTARPAPSPEALS